MVDTAALLDFGAERITRDGFNAPPPATQFGYDAAENRGRRKAPTGQLWSEDRELTQAKRRAVQSGVRDLRRNFSVAAWMIRRHLDYVASFRFRSTTGVDALDDQIDEFVRIWGKPENCDVSGRFSLRRLVRLMEALRVVDGDAFAVKLADGRVQIVESDRVREPVGGDRQYLPRDLDSFVQGVKINTAGKPVAYAVHKRGADGTNFEFERTVAARNVVHVAYIDRIDQVRGISPIVAAMNDMRDLYEAKEYALAKMKVSQLFALAFFRDATDAAGNVNDNGEGTDTAPKYDVDFGRGPVLLDLDPGDKAQFLESASPATQFQEFFDVVIGIAMKAVDIPQSFYNEAHTTFHSSRAAFNLYLKACRSKQEDLQQVLDQLTLWRLQLAIAEGQVQLPAGMTIGNLRWEWNPDGVQWWDKEAEIRGDAAAIAGGFEDWETVVKSRTGGDIYQHIDTIARVQDYAKAKGVSLTLAYNTVVARSEKTADVGEQDDAKPENGGDNAED